MPDETNSASSAGSTEVSTPDISTFTSEQRSEWLMSGKYPESSNKEDAAPSESKESAAEEAETDTTTDDGKPNDTQRESKPKRGAESRKQELAQEIQDLLAERSRIRKEVEETKAVKPAEPAPAKPVEAKTETPKKPPKPNIDDFETYEAWETAVEEANDKYLTDLADYKAKEAVKADREARQKESAERAAQEETQKTAKIWQSKVAEAKKIHDDFEEVAFNPKTPISETMQKFIVESEMGAEIAYQLGQDQEKASSIANMSDFNAVRELTRIELSIPKTTKEDPKPNKITRSNPPPTTIGGYGTSSDDAEEAALKSGDTRAYINARNAKEFARMRK
jgi:hypothetical protein